MKRNIMLGLAKDGNRLVKCIAQYDKTALQKREAECTGNDVQDIIFTFHRYLAWIVLGFGCCGGCGVWLGCVDDFAIVAPARLIPTKSFSRVQKILSMYQT